MTKHLRWSVQQLEEFLSKRHGPNIEEQTRTLKTLTDQSPLQLLLQKQDELNAWDKISMADFENKSAPLDGSKNKSSGQLAASSAGLQTSDGTRRIRNPLENSLLRLQETAVPRKKTQLSSSGDHSNKPASQKIKQRSRSIQTLDEASWSGSYIPQIELEILFHGVVLLSVNTLYGLTHFERVKYRKSWHHLIERAVSDLVGNHDSRAPFDHFIVRAHRVSRKMADTDAKNGYLKYAIDGLRYSGIIVEDTELHFRDLLCSQNCGKPFLALKIEAVNKDYIPISHRDDWAKGFLKNISSGSK